MTLIMSTVKLENFPRLPNQRLPNDLNDFYEFDSIEPNSKKNRNIEKFRFGSIELIRLNFDSFRLGSIFQEEFHYMSIGK